jgi:hypothetical protein
VLVGGIVFRRHRGEPLGVLKLADAPEERDGVLRSVSASLRVITLAISVSMVRRECGRRPGIVASEELGYGNCVPELRVTILRPVFACRTFRYPRFYAIIGNKARASREPQAGSKVAEYNFAGRPGGTP